jgi:gliding motility-associated-like protein
VHFHKSYTFGVIFRAHRFPKLSFKHKYIFPMKAVISFSLFFSLLSSSVYATPRYLPVIDTCRIPTLITPNDDGQNDDLVIPCLPKDISANKSELFVFNEWGERVTYYKPYLNDWHGTYKSQPLPDGTYFYIFRLNPSTEPQRGYITIFR